VLVQPREQALDIWRSMVNYAYRDGEWHWGGRSGSNSISDAEQMLCLLYPATNVPALRFDRPDEAARDVLEALSGLGNELQILRLIVDTLIDYMERYSEDGRPVFPGGSYFEPEWPDQADSAPTDEQRELEVVDSFSMSVTLTLSTLGFLQVLRPGVRSQGLLRRIDRLQDLTSQRLTGAMTGLLRSFSVRVFDYDSPSGQNLCSMINQTREPNRIVAGRLSRELGDIRSRLREELSIGSGVIADELDDPSRLFECGWSWGIVDDAGLVDYVAPEIPQKSGVAENRPYLYFTGVALDGIEDLFTERTRILGLLNETQQRLAQALQLRWELTLGFWNRVATFGPGRWPVEDVPWRTTDGVVSDYFTLFVASMVVQRIAARGEAAAAGADLVRIGALLSELANRGRITRRPLDDDPALEIHSPGIRLKLNGSEKLGPRQAWIVSSFSSLLFKRAIRVAGLVPNVEDRNELGRLADEIWLHLRNRRIEDGQGEGLWDEPSLVLPIDKPPFGEPSWYHTQRIVECLVAASWSVDVPPRPSEPMRQRALEYLMEAEHLFDQEKLWGTAEAGHQMRESFNRVTAKVDRARRLLDVKPGTALVLAQDVLRELDLISMARTEQSAAGVP
jgi:hypothetical protein